ncbi:MAG: precorrin-3B C17-methyltransferase [Candidatus Magnetoglobus multicellularis str. Araruama]|uniref:Precorrin-3B C17-methyltransferase n=1 Tax=Candidatus Magnetoglobus multicellularis str. Araruama TaxID=890399 RepID=A0A1V1P2X6_9BACT|nr:MAG: precorrin-3B C17-methyltransferase [Candidatus Magnetoglobus multicellularis str. Araruama]
MGYTSYVDLIKELISGKKIISTSMKKEVDRVQAAIEASLSGSCCAIISSGDPGIYAMAGLVFEICKKRSIQVIKPESGLEKEGSICLEVVPGIPAVASGASLLGAPLTHDFACISLSDLLTPWDLIEKRIEHAAIADFVIVLFNPKSKKRAWQLNKAQDIILKYRNDDTPVGLVKNAMRKKQSVLTISLKDLHKADVDMLTTVFIGSSVSEKYLDYMYTPRGYSGKYDIGSVK